MPDKLRQKTYQVLMWCCTSGNCDTCCNLPMGKRARVLHSRGLTWEAAEKIAESWKQHGPTIEEEVR